MVEAGDGLAVGQLQPALGAFQRLDVRLLIDRQHDGTLWRPQVECHEVGGLLRECRVGADAPAPPPRQRNLVCPQHPPDLVRGDVAEMPGQQGAVPPRVALRRRCIQRRDDPPLVAGVVVPRLAAARRVRHPGQAVLDKAPTPFADRRRARCQPLRRRLVAQPLAQSQNDLCPERQPLLSLAGRQSRLQRRALLAGQRYLRCSHSGTLSYTLTFVTRY